MNNFETELQKTIVLFEIMQKNLDYKTEIKVFQVPYHELTNSNNNQNKLNMIKVSLLYTHTILYENSYHSIPNIIFTIYIKEDMKGVLTKSFGRFFKKRDKRRYSSYENLKKTYKMLLDAQNSSK